MDLLFLTPGRVQGTSPSASAAARSARLGLHLWPLWLVCWDSSLVLSVFLQWLVLCSGPGLPCPVCVLSVGCLLSYIQSSVFLTVSFDVFKKQGLGTSKLLAMWLENMFSQPIAWMLGGFRGTCTPVFTAAMSTIAKLGKPNC